MLRASIGIPLAAIAAASLAATASAVPITYDVNRVLGPSVEGGEMTVVGTVTVEDTGPTVTDWDITVTSTALGRSFTLDPGNSSFLSNNTTVTATPTTLTIETGDSGFWGPQLRDDATTLRHEWFIGAELGTFGEQAFVDFADPDPDSDFANVPRTNPTVLFAVPEPALLWELAAALLLTATGAANARRER